MRTAIYMELILISLLLVAVWGIGLNSLFKMRTEKSEIIEGNKTISIEKRVLVFDEEQNKEIPITAILSVIVGASASILAIVFAVSNLIISNISERYTPSILKSYEEDTRTNRTLCSFILVAFFSLVLLLIQKIVQPAFSFVLLLIAISGFGVSLGLLIDYFFYMFKIINPLKFALILKSETASHVQNQDEREVQDSITSLGDVAVKGFERKEMRICSEYVKVLYDIFEEYLELRMREPEKYKLTTSFDRSKNRNCVLLYILDEYYRIFKYSILGKEETISKEIVRNLFSILYEILLGKENDDLVRQMIETRHVIGARYFRFYKLAIENRDISRFPLINDSVGILQIIVHLGEEKRVREDYLEEFIGSHLFRINQLIIDNDDFELFGREIADFSMMLPQTSPVELQGDISADLHVNLHLLYRDKDFMKFFDKKKAYIDYLVKHECAKNFRTTAILDKKLDDYESFLKKHFAKLRNEEYVKSLLPENMEPERVRNIEEISEASTTNISHKIQDIKKRVYELYVVSQICRMFFLVGAYLLFKGKHDATDSAAYIKELWSHTSPDDARFISLNRPPITFDPLWLTYLLLYGGEGNGSWLSLRRFGDFHSVTDYANKYYLLAIANKKGNLRMPSLAELQKLKEGKRLIELSNWYQFPNDYSSEIKSLLGCCDSLIENADNFDSLLSTKSKDEKEGLVIIGANEKLKAVKEWIEAKAEESKRTKQEVIKLLPLDAKRIEDCKSKILKSYTETNEISEMARIVDFNRKRDKDLHFTQVDQRPYPRVIPKDCFTEPSSVDCSSIWLELGRRVACGEMKCFIEKILKHQGIERIDIEGANAEEIHKKIRAVTNKLRKQGFIPSTICIPRKYLTEFEMRRYVTYEERVSFLKIDEKTRLKTIYSTNLVPFENVIILDTSASIWTYKPREDSVERLIIDVKELDEDKPLVNLFVGTTINLRIENPEGLRILRFKTKKNYSE